MRSGARRLRVILGGLLISTFLNLVLVPVLFARWGGSEADAAVPVAPDAEVGDGGRVPSPAV